MNSMIKPFLIITILALCSCGKADENTQKEYNQSENTVLELQKKADEIDKSFRTESEKYRVVKEEINKRNLFHINTMTKLFNQVNKSYPDPEKLKGFGLPEEIFSGSAELSTNKNGKGGWYYDQKSGEVTVNTL